MTHRIALCLMSVVLCSCDMGPRRADRDINVAGVNRALVQAPIVTIELVRVNGADFPQEAWDRARARFAAQVRGQVRVVDHGTITAPETSPGVVGLFDWPIRDDARLVERQEIEAAGGWYRVQDRTAGALGAIIARHDGETRGAVSPIVGRDTVLLAIVPRDRGPMAMLSAGEHWKAMGYTTMASVMEEDGRVNHMAKHRVVCHETNVRLRSRVPFLTSDKLWEWLILHELGHVLGVPGDSSHAFQERGLHCTHPTCVMYSPADPRQFLSWLKHGWPMDFCQACAAELAAARGE